MGANFTPHPLISYHMEEQDYNTLQCNYEVMMQHCIENVQFGGHVYHQTAQYTHCLEHLKHLLCSGKISLECVFICNILIQSQYMRF